MLKTYGVEAAQATIIQEVKSVFTVYGIDVDPRHLSMIADFMTFDGGFRPMNRLGMGQFSTSPFGKMTFETATKWRPSSSWMRPRMGRRTRLSAPRPVSASGSQRRWGRGPLVCYRTLVSISPW